MKHLIRIVLPLTGRMGLVRYLFLGMATGLSGFLFINAVTKVVGLLVGGGYTAVSREFLLLFAGIILFSIWSRRALSVIVIHLSLRISWSLRKEILSMALNANYQQLAARKTLVQTAILRDVDALTNASMAFIGLCISIIMTVSCLAYLATISLFLFTITLLVALAGATFYYFSAQANSRSLQQSRRLENKFQANLNAVLNGIKEIYIEPRKGRYIYEERIIPNANESYRFDTGAITAMLNTQITGQVFFYLLVTSVLLVFSVTLHIKAADVVTFVFTTLYLLGAVEGIMLQFPTFMRAGVSIDHLTGLKAELERANFSNPIPTGKVIRGFDHIAVRRLVFNYEGTASSFGIGPVDFDLRRGDTVFIYGGNGSGKTTFINCFLGLCLPASGEIQVDGLVIGPELYPEYKTLFTVVLSDFYLFDEVLLEEYFDPEKWDFYIRLFELEGKLHLEGRRFSTTDLSAGQRKRLALIIALMETKPILVIDEWAADQDPYFRKKFYTEIIPFLNEQGFTILAITHDDKYYSVSNRLFKMNEGRLKEEHPVSPVLLDLNRHINE
ncbi:MAG: cyclic peptide export ABC transporter [Bacteroidetes bacterium]|nr:cyclic peptide export ABC transporter [Bacteroidota bacterium]